MASEPKSSQICCPQQWITGRHRKQLWNKREPILPPLKSMIVSSSSLVKLVQALPLTTMWQQLRKMEVLLVYQEWREIQLSVPMEAPHRSSAPNQLWKVMHQLPIIPILTRLWSITTSLPVPKVAVSERATIWMLSTRWFFQQPIVCQRRAGELWLVVELEGASL